MRKLVLLPGGLLAVALLLLVLARNPQDESGVRIEEVARDSRATAAGVHAQVISGEDLPPEGTRSLFDHLIREQGALPFPFVRLVDMLAAYDEQQRRPNMLLIPDGRSLLKGFADFAKPRIVLASDAVPPDGASLAPLLRGRLFLGYAEAANEIEVISYNEAAGRFEFQLVENYCAGCVPRIIYAQRAICTTCHAGGAPIFPVRPWEETNVQPAIQQRIRARAESVDYHGAPLQRRLDDAQAFDDLTDVANVIPTTQKIWLDGCGFDGDDCRRQMLSLALRYMVNPAALDRHTPDSLALLELQSRHWPADGIAMDNGNLNNRNPLEQALYDDSFGAQLKNLLFPVRESTRSGDKLKDFDSLPALPAEFDPLSRRAPLRQIQASDLDGVYGLAQLFSPSDIHRIEAAANYDPARMEQAVQDLPAELLTAAPVQRIPIVQALLAALGQPPAAYCCLDVTEMSPAIAHGEPPLELSEGSPLKPFEDYCFACHRGNPSARLNFMSGADEATVLESIKGQDGIRDVLDYERYLGTRKASSLMPPEDSWQREALNEALQQGRDPLSAMREQVPTLFDF